MVKFKRINDYCVIQDFLNDEEILHNESGPARIYWHYTGEDIENCAKSKNKTREEYYVNGELFREDGPVIVRYANGSISYEKFIDNKDGIDCIRYKVKKMKTLSKVITYINGINHQIDYDVNGTLIFESYRLKLKFHNEAGPAIIWYNNGEKTKEIYFYNGKECTELQAMILKGLENEKYQRTNV